MPTGPSDFAHRVKNVCSVKIVPPQPETALSVEECTGPRQGDGSHAKYHYMGN